MRPYLTPGFVLALFMMTACSGKAGMRSKTAVYQPVIDTRFDVTVPADLQIRNASGDIVRDLPWQPDRQAEYRLNFRRSDHFILIAEPYGEAAETHKVTEFTITPDMLRSAPEDDGDRIFLATIDEKEYRPLVEYVVFIDARGNWQGWRSQSRAFESLGEEGGRPPQRVVDLGPQLAVEGMDISPDGSRLAYAQAEFVSDGATGDGDLVDRFRTSNIRSVALHSGGIQQMTSGSYRDTYPIFADGGKNLLFSSNRRRPQDADLLQISATERSGISNIYLDSRGLRALNPSQSNDGLIAFALIDRLGKEDPYIWTVGGQSQYPTQLVRGRQPRISPDGRRIAYIGIDDNLWAVDIEGTRQTQLTYDAAQITKRYLESLNDSELKNVKQALARNIPVIQPYATPSWSPDGEHILFSSMAGTDITGRPNHDIWIMDYDGSDRRQLTTNGSADRYPLMAPDRDHVYFISNRGKHWGIYQIESPGGIASGADE